jgi:acetyltransferase-like isoleucine patch superfamily enzyme
MMLLEDKLMAIRLGAGGWGRLKGARRAVLDFRLPVIRPITALLYAERITRLELLPLVLKLLYREPLLRYRCSAVGRRLDIQGPLPLIIGNGHIHLGDDVTIGGNNTWIVGFKVSEGALLSVGARSRLGFANVLSIASSVSIGDDTGLSTYVQIYDNISHPLEPGRRLRRESFRRDETAPVVIGNNVWIGTGAIIMKGVTIGDGSVVAAASVVTRSVPPNTLVAGNPAVVKKEIGDTD